MDSSDQSKLREQPCSTIGCRVREASDTRQKPVLEERPPLSHFTAWLERETKIHATARWHVGGALRAEGIEGAVGG